MIWGIGNPVPMMDAYAPARRQPVHQQLDLLNPDTGKMNWYFQYTPGDQWDFDEARTHILIDARGQWRASQAHHPFRPQRLRLHN